VNGGLGYERRTIRFTQGGNSLGAARLSRFGIPSQGEDAVLMFQRLTKAQPGRRDCFLTGVAPAVRLRDAGCSRGLSSFGKEVLCCGRMGIAIWLILPVVIRSSQRLSHACLSINDFVL
jgi:hypothetical protein